MNPQAQIASAIVAGATAILETEKATATVQAPVTRNRRATPKPKAKAKAKAKPQGNDKPLDIAGLWAMSARNADGTPTKNQFAATLDACRVGLNLDKGAMLPAEVFALVKEQSRKAASEKAASFHNYHTVTGIRQTEKGTLLRKRFGSGEPLKAIGFGVSRTTATRHEDLPVEDQIKAGQSLVMTLRKSLLATEEKFLNAGKTEQAEVADRAQEIVGKITTAIDMLGLYGVSMAIPSLPECIATHFRLRAEKLAKDQAAAKARREAPRTKAPKTVKSDIPINGMGGK